MEMKQRNVDYKKLVNPHPIKRLIDFVNHLEEKLSSVKIIHDKLHELMSIVSKTHENIVEELTIVKNLLYEQDEDEIIPIDINKSEWDDEEEEEEGIQYKKLNKLKDRKDSLTIQHKNELRLSSSTSNESSSTIENNSNSSRKKSSRSSLSTRKSSKSVTFNMNQNNLSQQKSNNQTFDEITTPINPYLSSELLKQNQIEINSNLPKILTNIRILEIEPENGDFIRLINLSKSDDYDLTDHFLQQNISSKLICRFRFPFDTIIRSGQTLTIWCGQNKNIIPQPPYVFLWKEQKKWETKLDCITILAKPNGQPIAWFRPSQHLYTDQSSSDVLFVHSKSNTGSSDISNHSSNTNNHSGPDTRHGRHSPFSLSRNNKPPFAHSPNNPVHPDHNGTTGYIPNDIRSQMHQKSGKTQLLNRPKSSPFANHIGCKQDLISMNYLRTQQTQRQKQTTIKT